MSLSLAKLNGLSLWTSERGFNRSHISKLAVLLQKEHSLSWGDGLRKAWELARLAKYKFENSLWQTLKPFSCIFICLFYLFLCQYHGLI